MNNSFSESYRQAGVDVTAGYRGVELMKQHVARTRTPFVLDSIGGFGGMLAPDFAGMTRPVLVSGTDGVGTKLKLAFLLDRHDTVGIDCVAMCVNDIICCGAQPLLFLDYIALGKNIPEKVAELVKGVSEGCVQAGCALVGGETAEMPGFYAENEYDLAGFSVGMVDEPHILKPEHCRAGDVLIALASSGVHSNGFSLVRKVFDIENADLGRYYDELGGTLGETLLTPTKIYVKSVLQAVRTGAVHAISHITGGGFYENIPRMLPDGLTASVEKDRVRVLPIFKLLMQEGSIPERDMYNTFNMGVGMVLAVEREHAEEVITLLNAAGETAYPIGELIAGERGVTLW